MNCGNTNGMKMRSSPLYRSLSNCEISPKKDLYPCYPQKTEPRLPRLDLFNKSGTNTDTIYLFIYLLIYLFIYLFIYLYAGNRQLQKMLIMLKKKENIIKIC